MFINIINTLNKQTIMLVIDHPTTYFPSMKSHINLHIILQPHIYALHILRETLDQVLQQKKSQEAHTE
jgi:hypothetical protein